jgi:hypothetical protein
MDEMMASVILRYVYVAMPQPEETAMNEHTSMLVGAPRPPPPLMRRGEGEKPRSIISSKKRGFWGG